MTRKIATILTTAALVLAPITAQAADRTPSPVQSSEQLAGEEPINMLAILVGIALAVAIAVVVIDEGEEEDSPASP